MHVLLYIIARTGLLSSLGTRKTFVSVHGKIRIVQM